MGKTLLKNLCALFCMAFAVTSMAQTTVTFTAGEDIATEQATFTKDGITLTIDRGNSNQLGTLKRTDNYRIYKGNNLTISSSVGNISGVEFTCTAEGTDQYGPGNFEEQDGYSFAGAVGTWTGNAASVVFNAAGAQVRATKIVVTIAGETGKENAGLAYSASEATVTLGQEPLTLPTLTNPNNLDVTYSSSDEAVATVSATGEVTPVAAGTAVIKASFAGNDTYNAGSASYTLTVNPSAADAISFAEAKTAILALDNNAKATLAVKFDKAVVTYVNGANAYIQQDGLGMLYYKYNHTYKVGDTFTGTATVEATNYNGTAEITSITGVEPVAGEAPEPIVATIEEINADVAKYDLLCVVVKGVTLDAVPNADARTVSISKGEATLGLYLKDKKADMTSLVAGQVYDIVGFPGTFKGAAQLNVFSADDFSDPTSTGINGVVAGNAAAGKIYTISGIQLNATSTNGLPAGVYIVNGKKVFVK